MNSILENIINYFKSYYLEILNLLLTIVLIVLVIIVIPQNKELKDDTSIQNINNTFNEKEKNNSSLIKVDIKGAIKKPGVYSVSENSIINDVIKEAGGLIKNASTENINLSKQVKNEMVIYISTKNQLKNKANNNITSSNKETKMLIEDIIVDTTSDETKGTGVENIPSLKEKEEEIDNTSKLLNINTCSKEELLTLNGIGESKAEKIIEYRNNNGLFKTIDDIKNVSGIGEQAFEKIKDYITV